MNFNYAQYKYCSEAKSKVLDWGAKVDSGRGPYTMVFFGFASKQKKYSNNNNLLLNGVTGVVITTG
jgi:hypothetical protein